MGLQKPPVWTKRCTWGQRRDSLVMFSLPDWDKLLKWPNKGTNGMHHHHVKDCIFVLHFLIWGWVSVEWCYTSFLFSQHTEWLNAHYCLHGYNKHVLAAPKLTDEWLPIDICSSSPTSPLYLFFFKASFHWYDILFLAIPLSHFSDKFSAVTHCNISTLLPQDFYILSISNSGSPPMNLRHSSVIHSHSTHPLTTVLSNIKRQKTPAKCNFKNGLHWQATIQTSSVLPASLSMWDFIWLFSRVLTALITNNFEEQEIKTTARLGSYTKGKHFLFSH